MIRVSHLSKRYGSFTALDDLSFAVAPGETLALLGPNGSGKTTTLKCLVGLAAPSAGEIEIEGFDLRRDPRAVRRLISYLPQQVNFPETMTAREVLAFYCRLRRLPPARIDWALDPARFHFNGSADKDVGRYSGGMRQRLGLAVACLPDVPVLLLDEPTASLDPEGAIGFRAFLSALKGEGKMILFSSHVLADVEQLADRVAILVDGRLAALKSIAALREELMRSARLRVLLAETQAHHLEAARSAGAREVTLASGGMLVTSRAEDRMAILAAIERAGGRVLNFATEERSLEDVYLHYARASLCPGREP